MNIIKYYDMHGQHIHMDDIVKHDNDNKTLYGRVVKLPTDPIKEPIKCVTAKDAEFFALCDRVELVPFEQQAFLFNKHRENVTLTRQGYQNKPNCPACGTDNALDVSYHHGHPIGVVKHYQCNVCDFMTSTDVDEIKIVNVWPYEAKDD